MQLDLALAVAGSSLVSSVTALAIAVYSSRKWKKVERGIGKIIKELKAKDEEMLEMIIDALTAKDTLSPKTVLAIVEAARLLAEDARRLYEKTGDDDFLVVAERWEAFVEANRRAVEKVLGYEKEPNVKAPEAVTA